MQDDTPTLKKPVVRANKPKSVSDIFNIQNIKKTAVGDWNGSRLLTYGLALAVVVASAVFIYYHNHPAFEMHPDTPSYTKPADTILATGNLVNSFRTPGYPLFLALIFTLFGRDNLLAVSNLQGILFIVTVIELYYIAYLIFARSWVAAIVGLMLGVNTFIFNYVKIVIAEGFTLWVLVTFVLCMLLWFKEPSVQKFWIMIGVYFLLFITRPDWEYLIIPLLAYLLFIMARRQQLRRFLPHAIAASLALYAVMGVYIYANSVQNHYTGVTEVQNINLLGKVLQYKLQDNAGPQYAAQQKLVDTFIQNTTNYVDPFLFGDTYPEFKADHWHLAGAYAQAAVLGNPLSFVTQTIHVMFFESAYDYSWSNINPYGSAGTWLLRLQKVSLILYKLLAYFPLFVAPWLFLLFWRHTTQNWMVEAMGAIILIALYEMFITAAGTYIDYPRLHVPVNALLTLIIWGTLLTGIRLGWDWWQLRTKNA